MKIFCEEMSQNKSDFQNLGLDVEDLGSHSVRKGAYSLAVTGSTVSPPIIYIFLCACWILGAVNERYLHYKKVGNNFLGRTVSGLDILSPEFFISPACFGCAGNTQE